jgi:plastocyanin
MGNEVVLRLIAYKPDRLEVGRGSTVRWKHEDAGIHTVTSGTVQKQASGDVETDPDGTFDSGRLEQGEEFAYGFDEAGSYRYFCRIHPATMQGQVTVD